MPQGSTLNSFPFIAYRDGARGKFRGGGVDKEMPTRKQLIVCATLKFEVPNLSCAQKFLGQKY